MSLQVSLIRLQPDSIGSVYEVMEKERTGTASSSAGKSSTPRASDKEEIKNLKARIKGYHTLG